MLEKLEQRISYFENLFKEDLITNGIDLTQPTNKDIRSIQDKVFTYNHFLEESKQTVERFKGTFDALRNQYFTEDKSKFALNVTAMVVDYIAQGKRGVEVLGLINDMAISIALKKIDVQMVGFLLDISPAGETNNKNKYD